MPAASQQLASRLHGSLAEDILARAAHSSSARCVASLLCFIVRANSAPNAWRGVAWLGLLPRGTQESYHIPEPWVLKKHSSFITTGVSCPRFEDPAGTQLLLYVLGHGDIFIVGMLGTYLFDCSGAAVLHTINPATRGIEGL